jgi:hypothetical protein
MSGKKTLSQGLVVVHCQFTTRRVLIDDPAHFHAHNPAPIGFAFLANLLRRATFADRVKQFDAVAVHHRVEGEGGEKAIRPQAVRGQQAQQARAFGQERKQVRELTLQPAIKAPKAPAFEGKQRFKRHQFARIQRAVGMFFDPLHPVIYLTEQVCNNVFGFHLCLLGSCDSFGNLTAKALFSSLLECALIRLVCFQLLTTNTIS